MAKQKDFCTTCRKNTAYTLQKEHIRKTIRNKDYTFYVTVAVCEECGDLMSPHGLIDKNIREIDEQYRTEEGLVSIEDIEQLMSLYNIGKAPLSLALGFGEVTITRYLAGQMPSKEYSDIIRSALTSPTFMKEKLNENKEKLAESAYNKAMAEASKLESRFSVSGELLGVIAYIFEMLEEVTPLSLQKLLYINQGVSLALFRKPLFSEDCQAWVHGPVYPEIYNMFRDFKYNPIDDIRFVIIDEHDKALSEDARKVVELVTNTFGKYGAKTLEKITHNEIPWQAARKNLEATSPSNEVITKESIESYYTEKNIEYDFSSEKGLNQYIRDALR